jgi:pSer/pThr/pTyr-binding forkhead associated (FHA) protein
MSHITKGSYLIVHPGDQTERIYDLTGEITIIGRDSICDIRIHDPSISRTHARIVRVADGSYTLEDLGSTNGTYVRGYPVNGEVALGFDEEIILGDGIIVILREGDFEPTLELLDELSGETQQLPPTRKVDTSTFKGITLDDLPSSDT